MTENKSYVSPLDNPFDSKHFITRILEISRKDEEGLFNEKEIDVLSEWIDPTVSLDEKMKKTQQYPPEMLPDLVMRLIRKIDEQDLVEHLLRCCWESSLNMNAHRDKIVELCRNTNDKIAIEACSVMKYCIRFSSPEEAENFLKSFSEKDFSKPYLYEMFVYSVKQD